MITKNKIYLFATIITIPLALIFWQILSSSNLINKTLFPSPVYVFLALVEMIKNGELIRDITISLIRIFSGFLIGSFLGIILGIMTGRILIVNKTIGQIIEIIRPIPAIAFLPLVILWFGVGEFSKILLIAFGSFFPVWINTHDGVGYVEKSYIWTAKSLGAKNFDILKEVVIPSATPFIISGLRIGIGSAFTLLVVAEMAGAFAGVGFRIDVSHLVFRTDKMLAGIVVLGILGAFFHKMFMILARKVAPWYEREN